MDHLESSKDEMKPCLSIDDTDNLHGLQSVNKEQMERSTLEMVKIGLQLSFKISRQICP
jgi:hypothetical protein